MPESVTIGKRGDPVDEWFNSEGIHTYGSNGTANAVRAMHHTKHFRAILEVGGENISQGQVCGHAVA